MTSRNDTGVVKEAIGKSPGIVSKAPAALAAGFGKAGKRASV